MHKTSGNKWNKRLCKWIVSLLTVTLLVNQSCLSVLAEEYEEYEYIEDTTDIATDEEVENSDVSDEVVADVDVDVDTETDVDAITNTESDVASNTESDMDADESKITIPLNDEEESVIEEEALEVDAEDTVSTASVGSIFTYDKLRYKIINDDIDNLQVEVTRYGDGKYTTGALDIPYSVTNGTDEYTVICIGDDAFRGYGNLTDITIPYSVINIGENAFYGCSSLTNITIPNSVTNIGYSAFARCRGLESITIPDSVTKIGTSAFYDCINLKNITIPDSVTDIGAGTFYNCSSLTSITIPDSVTNIGNNAFWGCSSLASITIPNNVTNIGYFAFFDCSSLTSITIPDNVTNIEEATFYNCSNLTSITIPDSVTYIGGSAFGDCSSLASITIPDSVTNIDNGAFGGCSSLTSITIPDNVTRIGYYTFSRCSNLTSITIPNKVASIGMYAFSGCNSLTNVKILNDNINIENLAFLNCSKLNSLQIALPENITTTPTIGSKSGDECFSQCPDDRSLTFLTEDGTTELSDSTTPTLADAVKAYNAVNDGDIDDGYWYGWKLPEAGVVTDNEETFTITVSAGIGGSVTPSGEVKVKSGDRQQFTITPEDGYWVSSILADGNEVLNSEQTNYDSQVRSTNTGSSTKYYVFENVTNDHTLAAYFETINTDDNSDSDDSVGNDTIDNDCSDDTNPVAVSESSTTNSSDIVSINTAAPAPQDNEPKTGYDSHIEIYATIAMIAGLSYLLLYFTDGKDGMTEDEKKEIIAALVKWAQKGKRLRRFAALAIIFLILVYYHSIGKRTAVECKSIEWKAVYEK